MDIAPAVRQVAPTAGEDRLMAFAGLPLPRRRSVPPLAVPVETELERGPREIEAHPATVGAHERELALRSRNVSELDHSCPVQLEHALQIAKLVEAERD